MRVSVERTDFLYVMRPDATPGVAHAVEYAATTRGFADVTLCGVTWGGDWNDLKPGDVRPVGSGNAGLCGVCDKVIRTRIREAREAVVVAHLRAQGEGKARSLLQELVLELSEVYGTLIDARRAIDRAVEAIHSSRTRMMLIVFEGQATDADQAREPQQISPELAGDPAGNPEQGAKSL